MAYHRYSSWLVSIADVAWKFVQTSMNKKIIIAVFVIGGAGVFNAIQAKKPLTPVILGSYIFLLVLSVLDMFGGQLGVLAGALAMVAVVFVLLNEFPWQQLIATLQGKTTTPSPAQALPPNQTPQNIGNFGVA